MGLLVFVFFISQSNFYVEIVGSMAKRETLIKTWDIVGYGGMPTILALGRLTGRLGIHGQPDLQDQVVFCKTSNNNNNKKP